MNPDLSTRIVERSVLSPSQAVRSVEIRDDQAILYTDASAWAVRPFVGPPDLIAKVELYDVARYVAAEQRTRPRGVARLADGSLHSLERPNDFRQVWAHIADGVSPRTLAWLLSFYHPGADWQTPHHHLIAERKDLGRLLSENRLAQIPHVLVQVRSSEVGRRLIVDFSTYSLTGELLRPRVTLHRWHVESGPAPGSVEWSTRPIAEDLEASHYPP